MTQLYPLCYDHVPEPEDATSNQDAQEIAWLKGIREIGKECIFDDTINKILYTEEWVSLNYTYIYI